MRDDLVERFRRGDRQALSRLLTHAAHGDFAATLPVRNEASKDQRRIVAFTGSGGVGKSTLVGKLIEVARGHCQTVAVLACDPQSPLSGGALLGDRFRMPSRPEDDGVFIRSIATAGDRGAVAQHVGAMARLLQAFGFDFVFLETAGAGQGDTAVRAVADVVVLLLQPETGDDLQWEKAGLLEVADVVVVHKADLPGSSNVEAQVNAALQLGGRESARVVRASARTGEGLERLWQLHLRVSSPCPFPDTRPRTSPPCPGKPGRPIRRRGGSRRPPAEGFARRLAGTPASPARGSHDAPRASSNEGQTLG